MKIKSFECPKFKPASHCFIFNLSKYVILGPSDAWSMRQSTQQHSILYWRLSDFLFQNEFIANVFSSRNFRLVSDWLKSVESCCQAVYFFDLFWISWESTNTFLLLTFIKIFCLFNSFILFNVCIWGFITCFN